MSTPIITDVRARDRRLLRRGQALEVVTMGWNIVGIVVLAIAAIQAQSIALAGFGLDSLIEIGASTVVLWELAGRHESRQHRALRLIAYAFLALAAYLLVQAVVAFGVGLRPHHSVTGLTWTGVTALVMFALSYGKHTIGIALNNPVLITEGKVTLVDGLLATVVLLGVLLNLALDWWWADPVASLVIVYYAIREARHVLAST